MAESKTPDDILARRAQELEALRQQEHDAFAGDQREMTGEASIVSQHPADVADFTYQRELNQTTQSVLEQEAEQVEEAMRARERGTYGQCEECGRQIPAERLEARPAATLCVECQRKRDGSRA
jgi:RNA polymerase-binding transcription factor DksA